MGRTVLRDIFNKVGGDYMGILYDLLSRSKKRCTMCGCHMYDDSDSDICEVCVDELLESDPGEPEEVDDW